MEKISEQKVYCKIRAQLGFPQTEIHADLQNVYGNGALKYATVCKWVCRFNDGRESIKMTLGWVGRFPFWWKRTLLLWKR